MTNIPPNQPTPDFRDWVGVGGGFLSFYILEIKLIPAILINERNLYLL